MNYPGWHITCLSFCLSKKDKPRSTWGFFFAWGNLNGGGSPESCNRLPQDRLSYLFPELLLILCGAALHSQKSGVLKSIPSPFCLSIKNLLSPLWIQGLIPSFSWRSLSWAAAGFLRHPTGAWTPPSRGPPIPAQPLTCAQISLVWLHRSACRTETSAHSLKSHFSPESAGVMQ